MLVEYVHIFLFLLACWLGMESPSYNMDSVVLQILVVFVEWMSWMPRCNVQSCMTLHGRIRWSLVKIPHWTSWWSLSHVAMTMTITTVVACLWPASIWTFPGIKLTYWMAVQSGINPTLRNLYVYKLLFVNMNDKYFWNKLLQ